ncbi:YncE family protein [Pedobacter sp. SYP-B3415]|uniref:YncE family protein n=1 Tax=Pedobacter sp. SYP-B3415 TaxID=2496641 RepID=UPI00101DADF6|nr:DUF5074 domain-containing protein [Pedobacter sp. SYP-B3415]
MNKNYKKLMQLAAGLALPFVMASCSKTGEDEILEKIKPEPVVDKTVGIYVLNEGAWPANNSSISYHDIAGNRTEADIFQKVNGRALGQSANDLKRYGSKMYCVVSGSLTTAESFVVVMDVNTGKLIKEISFNQNGKGVMPRSVAFSGSKAYVSAYDGSISQIDTASLLVDKKVAAGSALEGIAIANGKLYVINTANDYTVPGSGKNNSVSVLRLADLSKLKDVEVGLNPTTIAAGPDGTLLVGYAADYSAAGGGVVKLSTVTDQVMSSANTEINSMVFSDNTALAVGGLYRDGKPFIGSLDPMTLVKKNDFIQDQVTFTSPYALTVNPFDKAVLLTDSKFSAPSGEAIYFSAAGKKIFSFATGTTPQRAVFVYSYK